MAFTLLLEGNLAPASGWLARAGRLAEAASPGCAEHGLLLLPAGIEAAASGDHGSAEAAFARAAEIGARAGDADLRTLALHFQGRALVTLGRAREGVALLDEAMVAVVAGEVWSPVAGNIYCSMIDACFEIFDLRRAHEWTNALTAWWAKQPDLTTFTGQCLIHRAEILQLHGAWPEALDATRRARERLAKAADRYATGAAFYREAELYRVRGELARGGNAYRGASEWGHPGQPGLALLWLAEGKLEAAARSIRRVVAETIDRLGRAKLLPAEVEVMLAVGEVGAARQAADRARRDRRRVRDTGTAGCGWPVAGCRPAGGGRWPERSHHSSPGVGYLAAARRPVRGSPGARVDRPWLPRGRRRGVRSVGARCGPQGLRRPRGRTGHGAGRAADAQAGRRHGTRADPRELQVLRLLATGKTNHAIAADLVIAEKTVDRHVTNIFAKLGVSSRAAATAYAYEHHLL